MGEQNIMKTVETENAGLKRAYTLTIEIVGGNVAVIE